MLKKATQYLNVASDHVIGQKQRPKERLRPPAMIFRLTNESSGVKQPLTENSEAMSKQVFPFSKVCTSSGLPQQTDRQTDNTELYKGNCPISLSRIIFIEL